MGFKLLFILVEGDSDRRFFERIVKPRLLKKYDSVEIRPYAQLIPADTRKLLKSTKSKWIRADYLYITDINESPCISEKRDQITDRFGDRIDQDKIIIVVKEIESWYLAGLTDNALKELKIRKVSKSEHTTKEIFDSVKPKQFDSRRDFMVEILKRYSVPTAKQKNKSFKYFFEKFVGGS